MRIGSIIPVHGRLPLITLTVERLLKKNGLSYVLCVGSTDEEKEAALKGGAEFLFHDNQPLGRKWNAGFKEAQNKGLDAVLFMGSSDWVSDNWVQSLTPYLNEFDLIGSKDFYMLDIGTELRACRWFGYANGSGRENEPIGIGRLISERILNYIDWQPFDNDQRYGLDNRMMLKCLDKGGKLKLVNTDELGIKSLSISTNRWTNMHKFDDHWNDKIPSKSIRIEVEPILKQFPEYERV